MSHRSASQKFRVPGVETLSTQGVGVLLRVFAESAGQLGVVKEHGI